MTSSSSATLTSSATWSSAEAAPTSTPATASGAGCTPRSISSAGSVISSNSQDAGCRRRGTRSKLIKKAHLRGPALRCAVARLLVGPGRGLAGARTQLRVRRALGRGDHAREVVLRDRGVAGPGEWKVVPDQHLLRLDLDRRHLAERHATEPLGHAQHEGLPAALAVLAELVCGRLDHRVRHGIDQLPRCELGAGVEVAVPYEPVVGDTLGGVPPDSVDVLEGSAAGSLGQRSE